MTRTGDEAFAWLRELRLFDFGWSADRDDFFFVNRPRGFRARALVVIDE